MTQPESLLTVGEIARRLDQEVHRVEYVIRSRNIRPVSWAGHARVFRDSDLERIGSELRRIAEDRGEIVAATAGEQHSHGE
ncbi:MAG: hypothetical protein H8E66_06935 [Planctomycetes bacterium]|nr:hypothetical protein [Planctomycetota bacterium]